jgi:5'-3' exonuclease
MVFCWDGEDTDKSWRHKLAKTYKENRRKKGEKPQEVKDVYIQIPHLKLLLSRMGFLQVEVPTLEADDLIGIISTTLSKKVGRVLIYSSDKDFFQLIKKNVFLIRDLTKDKSKKCAPITAKQIEAEFGVLPKNWVKYRSFIGDKSDDIYKPVKGLGPVTVKKILAEGTDPTKKDGCTSDKVRPHWKAVRLNYKLTKIVRRVDDKRLPLQVKKEISELLSVLHKVKSDTLFRSSKGKSKESYRAMLDTLSKFELDTLLEQRHSLWKLP